MYKFFSKIKSIFFKSPLGRPHDSCLVSLTPSSPESSDGGGVHPERAQASLLSGTCASCARYKDNIVTLLNIGNFDCHVSWDSETGELVVSEGEEFDPYKY